MNKTLDTAKASDIAEDTARIGIVSIFVTGLIYCIAILI